jgi:hypothetical protein
MFALIMIGGQPALVMVPPDALDVDPYLVRQLHTSEEQRAHCAACPLSQICVTLDQYQIERARAN